ACRRNKGAPMRRFSSERGRIGLAAPLLAAGIVLASPKGGSSDDSLPSGLVAYRVTWHARTEGSVPMHVVQETSDGFYELNGEFFHSEVAGSAIVLIKERNGQLVIGQDMRYLGVSARDGSEVWRFRHDPKQGDCLSRTSQSIAEPHLYAGT